MVTENMLQTKETGFSLGEHDKKVRTKSDYNTTHAEQDVTNI